MKPPDELDGEKVLRYASIDDDVRPTGATKHSYGDVVDGEIVAGEPLGQFAALAIQGDDDAGYFLLYLDADGSSVTDTWHETLDDALGQAEFEYEGITAKWVVP